MNLHVPGFALILAGLLMNFLVIGINGGMPVDGHALIGSGQADTLHDAHRGRRYVKHHLASDEDQLLFLADVDRRSRRRSARPISAGDIVTYTGVAYVVVAGMRRDRRRSAGSDRALEAEGAPSALRSPAPIAASDDHQRRTDARGSGRDRPAQPPTDRHVRGFEFLIVLPLSWHGCSWTSGAIRVDFRIGGSCVWAVAIDGRRPAARADGPSTWRSA